MPPPYKFTKEGDAHCPTFTATVEINGASYAGDPANSKKDATSKAACKAIRPIDPHYCEFVADSKQTISIFLSYPYVLCNILTFLVPFTILIVSDHATDPLESHFM